MIKESVGITETKFVTLHETHTLESSATIKDLTIAYEQYGRMNEDKSNVILVCHALTGDAHLAGYHKGDKKPGWWEIITGQGKALDTTKYCIICSNVIGGCSGTTGPSSINPDTGKPYGASFPVVTIADMVRIQKKLCDSLQISSLYAIVGGSMGGMQALTWAHLFPDFSARIVVIASTGYSTPQQIAFNEVGRSAIRSDPAFKSGNYYPDEGPVKGLALARMIGHITYLSDESMHNKFGRNLQYKEVGYDFSTDFQVESYLHHQGDSFVHRFDANSYLYITKAVDYYDLTVNGSLTSAFEKCLSKFLIISISSDWLYPPYLSKEIVAALTRLDKDVEYCEIQSSFGHDGFLLEDGQMNYQIGRFLSHLTVGDQMIKNAPTVSEMVTIKGAAALMIAEAVNHLPVVSTDGELVGIVTSWDISKSIAHGVKSLDEIMTRAVLTAKPDELVNVAIKRMHDNKISALPVVNEKRRVIGLITTESLSGLVR